MNEEIIIGENDMINNKTDMQVGHQYRIVADSINNMML